MENPLTGRVVKPALTTNHGPPCPQPQILKDAPYNRMDQKVARHQPKNPPQQQSGPGSGNREAGFWETVSCVIRERGSTPRSPLSIRTRAPAVMGRGASTVTDHTNEAPGIGR